MFNIIKIALLCIVAGAASIPVSFGISKNPFVVWIGNGLGSLFSAFVVIYIADHLTNARFKEKVSKRRMGRKVVTVFDEGDKGKKTIKVRVFINKHGLRIFSLLCPIFPGVLVSTAAVYILDLDKKIYKRWMYTGLFFVSGAYVFSYWWVFVKT